MVTFSKRRKGLFKKAHELHSLTGADIAVVAFSPAGRPFSHGEPSFDATIDKYLNISGKDKSNESGGRGGECNSKVKEEMMTMKSWLEVVKVEAYESVEDLVSVKNVVEEMREKVLLRLLQIDR